MLKILGVSVPYLTGIWYEALHGHDTEVIITPKAVIGDRLIISYS